MKQKVLLFVLLAALCGLTGCGAAEEEETPLIMATSGEETLTPYVRQTDMPEEFFLRYEGDLKLSLRDGMELQSMRVCDACGNLLWDCTELDDLDMLDHGWYGLELEIGGSEEETYSCLIPLFVRKPVVVVTSGGETVEAYDHWENSFDGALYADGPPLYDVLPEIDGQIPVLCYGEDFSFSVREDVKYHGMRVIDEKADSNGVSMEPEELAELDAGTYYVAFSYVDYDGDRSEHQEGVGYSGGRCVVKLIIDEPVSP